MLASLARALRLTSDERDYLFLIAGHNAPTPVTAATHVAPALLRVLDRLSDTPALILSNLGETLVQNRMAERCSATSPGYTAWPAARSTAGSPPRRAAALPRGRRDRQSRAQVANLRAAYGSMGPRSRAGDLCRPAEASQEFASLRERLEVARRFEDHKNLIHPELGPIEVDCQVLFTEDQSRRCSSSLPRLGPRPTRSCSSSASSGSSGSPSRAAEAQRALTLRLPRRGERSSASYRPDTPVLRGCR